MYRFFTTIFRPLLWLLYPLKIINKDKLPTSKAIILCNHYSLFDIALHVTRVFKKEYHALAKQELFKNRFFGWFLRKMGAIQIDRNRMDMKAFKQVIEILKSDKQLVIFPEGTRNKNEDFKQMLPLKSGAAFFAVKTKSPVTIMMYYRKPRLFRRNYLYIGDTIQLDEFWFDKSLEMADKVTEIFTQKFLEMRAELDALVENK